MKYRLLVFIVAYNAEKTIERVLGRIPSGLKDQFEIEVLVIDDSSKDATFERAELTRRMNVLPFPIHVLFNPVNQGYGGNQKIGFHYAIERGFDFVALVHGDGQYAPERLPELLQPLVQGEAEAVFGSRMLDRGGALNGGMPLYKFVGNKILTWFQNSMLRARLSEFHSGYRIYTTRALKLIPFDKNTNVFHFDTEIIIQLLRAGMRIKEVPIPTYYGEEICHVNGLRYAWDVVAATTRARLQEMNLFYDSKFDCAALAKTNSYYTRKLDFLSPSTVALERITLGARVLDLGCAGGYLADDLGRRGSRVTAVDLFPLAEGVKVEKYIQHDLNNPLPVDGTGYDFVLALDVIEHLSTPEQFVENLKTTFQYNPDVMIVASTGNVGFIITRLMLLAGQFNYGKRGILDLTHTRLFTISSFKRLFAQAGYEVIETRGIPAPFPLVLGSGVMSRVLLWINIFLIQILPSWFSYQMTVVARPRPALAQLLRHAVATSKERAESIPVPENGCHVPFIDI